jgi:hypothetical protein
VREGLRVRELANDEGNRLLRIVRRCSGSVVTWRRAQMVLLSAQGMDIAQIARVALTWTPSSLTGQDARGLYDVGVGPPGGDPGWVRQAMPAWPAAARCRWEL